MEVRWLASAAELDNAIDPSRLRRVAAAAEAISARFVRPGDVQRIDVILVAPWAWPRVIENAGLE